MFRSRYIPISVAWELTLACNMKCTHCGSSAGQSRQKELTTKEALDLCDQLHDLNAKVINLTGGEPILRKDWPEIAKKIVDLDMDVSILSNGLALDEKVVSKIRKLGVYAIAISLDGGTPKTHDSIRGVKGSFDKCIASLELLKRENLPTTVITTVHKENIKELPFIREKILGKTKAWQIQIAVPIGRFPKNLILSKDEFYSLALFIVATRRKYSVKELAVIGAHSMGYHSQLLRNTMVSPVWKGCQAGITTIGIQSDGGIKGCLSLPNNYIEDNIRNRSLTEIWNDSDFAFYNRKFKQEDLKGDCKNCKYGKSCKGGCGTASTALTNEFHCDPYCLYLTERELIV
ncbi:MAG: radical SAM protein [Thermoplasmatales archaeon]|nr:MAG: radical SAM protein [Thermoplasmatales archaeon]